MFRALQSPQQKPRSPGLRQTKNAATRYLFRGIRRSPTHRRAGIPNPEVYRRLQGREYSIARGTGREAHRLPSINHTSLWVGVWMPTLRTRTARSAACRCNCGARLQRTTWVPSVPALTATGVASSSTFPRARKLWNSPRQLSCRAKSCHPRAAFYGGGKAVNTDSAAANAAPAAAHIVCSGNRSCPSRWPSPCSAQS